MSSLVGMIDASTSPDRMRYYVSFSIIIFCCVVVIESFLSSLLPSSSAHSYFFCPFCFVISSWLRSICALGMNETNSWYPVLAQSCFISL